MIKQSIGDSDSILLKKFKILRTSIMLGNYRNRESIMKEYEETAREIDKINKNVYEELLASKMYTTMSLEEEQTRLKELIDFIEKRIKERNDFIDDYTKGDKIKEEYDTSTDTNELFADILNSLPKIIPFP